jgi:hypothetical protein
MIMLTILSCKPGPGKNVTETGRLPSIDPDYSGITIPVNIAPLDFRINDKGIAFAARISGGKGKMTEIRSRNGIIKIRMKKWKEILGQNKGSDIQIQIYSKDKNGKWFKYKTIVNEVSSDPIDKYLTYRVLYPGYESWKEISIKQRNLETFREWTVVENSIADQNCINCHSFNNPTGDFLFHVRGSLGGTCFYDGRNLRKVNLKPKEMKNGAVYPSWHPSGRFVAFSSNRIVQQFHSSLQNKVEVSDLESSLLLYDVANNKIMDIRMLNDTVSMDTYPEWSPEGRWLYFCRAKKERGPFDYSKVHYDLYRTSFDTASLNFGNPEPIFIASDSSKSVSFPRVSPDGRYLVFTLHDYGCFPIWHKEADLYLLDLSAYKIQKMGLNSDFTESWHTWSSGSRWLVFSSKRTDGLTARPYISHIDEKGNTGKPFILPQKDPEFYQRFIKTFNLPELSTIKIKMAPGEIRRSVTSKAVQAEWLVNQ